MENKRIVKILIFVIAIIALSISNSYAAVEIKDTTSVLTNKTISEFYDMSEEMKNPGQGLEGTSVDVKMANNYEWAAVSYFSNSNYGTGGAGQNTGVQIPDTSHYSTNGNITGVMNWGKTLTLTAGIIDSYASQTLTNTGGESIINAVKNPVTTNRIDKFGKFNINDSIAATRWYSAWCNADSVASNPYSYRIGIFGFVGGYALSSEYYNRASGAAFNNETFRPVFYAQ